MTNIDIAKVAENMKQQKEQPTLPLAPIYRIIKYETGKLVASDASEVLHKIFYEEVKEILRIANDICEIRGRKTITGDIIRVAYSTLKAQVKK